MINILKGNSKDLVFAITDSNGDAVATLSTATPVTFVVKKNKTDTNLNALIKKELAAGITVDDPINGSITVSLDADDTDIDPDIYYMGLQITFADGSVQEIIITQNDNCLNRLEILQDIVHA